MYASAVLLPGKDQIDPSVTIGIIESFLTNGLDISEVCAGRNRY